MCCCKEVDVVNRDFLTKFNCTYVCRQNTVLHILTCVHTNMFQQDITLFACGSTAAVHFSAVPFWSTVHVLCMYLYTHIVTCVFVHVYTNVRRYVCISYILSRI